MIKKYIKSKYSQLHESFGKNFYHDPIMLTLIVLAALEALSVVLIIFFTIQNISGLVPIAYNSIYGVISLGSFWELYAFGFGISLMLAINLLISWAFFDKERLISYLLGFCNLILGSLGIIVISNLVILGGR